MKFKYKKIILLTLLSTMGIGVVTLAITPKNHKPKETAKVTTQAKDLSPTPLVSATSAPTITAAPTITVTPTPASLPVNSLESDGYPQITKLINNYYDAKLECNTKKLETLLSDASDIPSKKHLKEDVQFIEGYNKIKCYVKKGAQDGTYIVFVYNEIKFFNIKTPAPAVDQFYIITDKDQSVKIFSGELDKQMQDYYHARIKDSDVKKLLDKTDKKSKKAKAKDKDLKTFWNKLAEAQSGN